MNSRLLIDIFIEALYNKYGLFLDTFNHNYIATNKNYENSFYVKIKSDKNSYNIAFTPGNKSGLFFRSNSKLDFFMVFQERR